MRKFKVGDLVEHDPEAYSHALRGKRYIITEVGEDTSSGIRIDYWIRHGDVAPNTHHYEWAYRLAPDPPPPQLPTTSGAEEYEEIMLVQEAHRPATG